MAAKTKYITISNFKEELTAWSPDSPNQLYAIVDMGRLADPQISSDLVKIPRSKCK
jgi:hypothetical protein